MTAPPRNDESLTRHDELAISSAALADVPWAAAGVAGVVVFGADLVLHLTGGSLGLASSLSAGTVAAFAVAGGGAVLRRRASRAALWARNHPWRFAILPGVAAAIVVFVISVLVGSSGIVGGAFTSIWHGAIAYGLTGAAGIAAGNLRRDKGRTSGH
jgi:hypothetical protein